MKPASGLSALQFVADQRVPISGPSRRLQALREALRRKRLFHPTWQDDELAQPRPANPPSVAPRDTSNIERA